MSIGTRRSARERALSLLYEAEVKGVAPLDLMRDLPVPAPPFVADLVQGVGREQVRIDDLIGRYAQDWAVERMPVIDRNLLRLAVYELAHRPEIPAAAVISEAVELAKGYSTEESGRFVNGVLSSITAEVRPS